MKTTVSLSRKFGAVSFSLSQSAILNAAVIATIVSFLSILADLDLFAYLCGAIALAAVRAMEKGGKK